MASLGIGLELNRNFAKNSPTLEIRRLDVFFYDTSITLLFYFYFGWTANETQWLYFDNYSANFSHLFLNEQINHFRLSAAPGTVPFRIVMTRFPGADCRSC